MEQSATEQPVEPRAWRLVRRAVRRLRLRWLRLWLRLWGLQLWLTLPLGFEDLVLGFGLRPRFRLRFQFRFLVWRAHQLLGPTALGETLEVATDRAPHVVQVAFLSH